LPSQLCAHPSTDPPVPSPPGGRPAIALPAQARPLRPLDPVECPAILTELAAAGREELTAATEELLRLSGGGSSGGAAPRPALSSGDVVAWYAARAVALDEAAGQLGHAVTLLELGAARGAGGRELARLAALGRLLGRLVAAWWPGDGRPGGSGGGDAAMGGVEAEEGAGAVAPPAAWAVTLGGFMAMQPLEQAALLLECSSEGRMSVDVRDRCVAGADRAGARGGALLDELGGGTGRWGHVGGGSGRARGV